MTATDFGCWIVYCIKCPWVSETCRDTETLVAAHRVHTEHILGLTGASRELIAGEMAALLPRANRATYWERKVGEFFDAALVEEGPS